MSPLPAVSIVMPAYSAAATLLQSIRSVQAQTLANWELIIVDDGSPDETAEIAETAAALDQRLRVIRQRNAGPSAARNHGVRLSRAPVIAFLDADDLWAPERLAGMLEAFARSPEAGVLFSRTRFMDPAGQAFGTLTSAIAELTAADLMAENAVCSTSNIVCRRAVFNSVGAFVEGLHHAEDQDWLLRVALDGRWRIRGVDAEWFFYRSSPDSQSADLDAMRAGWLRLVETALADYPHAAPQAASAASAAFAPFHRQLARRALRMRRPAIALRYLAIALGRDPGLMLREPKRTALTLAGALIACLPSPTLKEFVAR